MTNPYLTPNVDSGNSLVGRVAVDWNKLAPEEYQPRRDALAVIHAAFDQTAYCEPHLAALAVRDNESGYLAARSVLYQEAGDVDVVVDQYRYLGILQLTTDPDVSSAAKAASERGERKFRFNRPVIGTDRLENARLDHDDSLVPDDIDARAGGRDNLSEVVSDVLDVLRDGDYPWRSLVYAVEGRTREEVEDALHVLHRDYVVEAVDGRPNWYEPMAAALRQIRGTNFVDRSVTFAHLNTDSERAEAMERDGVDIEKPDYL